VVVNNASAGNFAGPRMDLCTESTRARAPIRRRQWR
jgi:hypothetical protein